MEPLTLIALGLWLFGGKEEATITTEAVRTASDDSALLGLLAVADPHRLPGDETIIDPQDAEAWIIGA
jgi:hypothetical protein